LIVGVMVAVLVVTFGMAVGDILADRARALSRRAARAAGGASSFIVDQGYALVADIRRLSAASRARNDRRPVVDRVRDYGL
jgi:hypothetical protein